MTFDEFQRKRGFISHNVLKNGVVMRLPEECVNFILGIPAKEENQSMESFSSPKVIDGNLREAALTWVRGVDSSSSGVVESLTSLLDMTAQIKGFRRGDDFDARSEKLKGAANACSPVMVKLAQGDMHIGDGDWMNFLSDLKSVVQLVDEMRGGHPEFQRWIVSTRTIPNF